MGIGGGRISLCDGLQSVVRHFAQCSYMALQLRDVSIGVEKLRHVEHLARPCVVVEIVVGENLHQFDEIGHVEGELLLRAVHPCLHRVVGVEKSFFVYVWIDDFIGFYQVATGQHERRNGKYIYLFHVSFF